MTPSWPVARAAPPSPAYVAALERLLASPTLPKLGLRRMEALMVGLGRPQDGYRCVHIAGTKGKGSTSAMTASILRAAGCKVGLTTSPHLLCARERIVVGDAVVDAPISEATFVDLERRVDAAARALPAELEVPSFFERLCAMAFCAFKDAGVDVAVVEVGLGGRLDATNIVGPAVCGVTRLGLDHMEFLGPTLAHIAAEKAGIFKPGVPAWSSAQDASAAAVLADVAGRVGAPLSFIDEVQVQATPPSSLSGRHQRENAALAVALARALDGDRGLLVDDDAIAHGLASARWPGRYETVATSPLVILDGAHDGLATTALAATLADDGRLSRPLHLVVGCSTGHPPDEVLAPLHALPWASVTATAANHPRAIPSDEVAAAAVALSPIVEPAATVDDAVARAVARARRDGGTVIVTGSLFVVGEARALFVAMPMDPARPRF